MSARCSGEGDQLGRAGDERDVGVVLRERSSAALPQEILEDLVEESLDYGFNAHWPPRVQADEGGVAQIGVGPLIHFVDAIDDDHGSACLLGKKDFASTPLP